METAAWPLEQVALATLRPHPQNDGTHPPVELEHLQQSLTEHGIYRNIVIAQDNTILAGHGVVTAAQALGLTHLPVRRMPYAPDDPRALKLLVGDNHIARLREQDEAALVALLQNVSQVGVEALLGTGFDEAALEALLTEQGLGEHGTGEQAGRDAEPQIDRAEELREQYGVEGGQLWACGAHRVIVGDCTEKVIVERLLDGTRVEAVITDPPYGLNWDTDYTRFTKDFDIKRVHYPGIIADEQLFDPHPWLNYPKVILWGANWYCQHIPLGSWLVWDKRHTSGAALLSDAELAWMKGKRGIYLYAETVQGAIRKERSMHPTQKPVGLMEWCIEKAEVSNMVFDPYLGSGTTLIACENLGRVCYGCDVSPAYTAVTLERWAQVTGEQPQRLA